MWVMIRCLLLKIDMKGDILKNTQNSLITILLAIMASIPIHHLGANNGFIAESNPVAAKGRMSPAETDRTSMFQIGANYTHVNIKPGNASGFHGNMGGLQAIYEYRPLNCLYAAVKALWREGNTAGHDARRSLIDIDAHERLGYTIATKEKQYLLTLFTGIGYRYLSHKLHQSGSVMKLNYNEFYVPVGALNDFKINTLLSVGLYFTWMPQVNSTVNLVPSGGAQWVLKKRLTNFLVELPWNFSMGTMKQILIIFKPFYEYWRDGPSTAVTSTGIPLGVPGNTYNFWGAELNFGYKF